MLRAKESARPDRLFDDPLAADLAGPEGVAVLARMEERSPGASRNPAIPVRTKFFDDTLTTTIAADPDLRQLVLVAAGMDSRAFRLGLPPELTVFELDQPDLLAVKESRLAGLGATPRCPQVPVPVELTGPWTDALTDAGFDPSRPALWHLEGLLPYLTTAEVDELIGRLSELSTTGSRLTSDMFSAGFLSSSRLADFRAMMDELGSPLRFGTDTPDELFRAHGWRAEVTRFGAPEADFGRWIMPPGFRDDPAAPHGYLVVASR